VQVFDNIPGIITYQYINSAYFIVAFLLKIAFLCSLTGKVPDDNVPLGELKLKHGVKIMMMGTREEEIVRKQYLLKYRAFFSAQNSVVL